ncbi:MAG: exosortase system-associated protein, TIGR04073 family [Candidatus Omnitrophota bacterium]
MKKIILLLFLAVFLNSAVTICSAEELEKDFSANDKFTRSVVNIATFYLEVPRTVYETTKDKNLVTGVLYGLPLGFAKGLVRFAVGVVELGTFPFEPFEPLLEPEFLLLER